MKKLLKALGITIALITVGAVTRARVKKDSKELSKDGIKIEAPEIKLNGSTYVN